MYTTPTTAIVAAGTVTPVAGSLLVPTSTAAETVLNAAPVAGPGLAEMGPGFAEVAGVKMVNEPEVLEVLGVKISRGVNPLVDAVHGLADGSLPMTGTNVLFLALSAITIILMGLALVRIGRNLTTAKA
ncbi:MAG TPA: hypothetical protein VNA14_03835 [Mycobacteriales bacterium]|nr:hypothetical protein [Mycobacteriales bacterium]